MKLIAICVLYYICLQSLPIYGQVDQISWYPYQDSIELLDSLGIQHYDLKEYKIADSLFRLSLKLKQKSSPKDDLDIAFSYHKIGNVKGRLRDYKDALENYHTALELRQAHLEVNDPDILNLYKNIAHVHRNIGDYENAELFFLTNIDTRIIHNGTEDPELGELYFFLGLTYISSGKFKNAIPVLEKSIKIQILNSKDENIELANSYQELARAYQLSEQFDRALRASLKALKIKENMLEPSNPRFISTYNAVGHAYLLKGNFEKAIPFFESALDIQVHLRQDLRLASTYTNLGLAMMHSGEFVTASHHFNNALEINLRHPHARPLNIATAYNNLAALHSRMGDFKKCEFYIEKALDVYSAHSEVPQPDLAKIIQNLGTMNLKNEKLVESLDFYEKSLDMLDSIYHGEPNRQAASVYDDIGVLYIDMKDYDTANQYIIEGLNMRIDILGEKNVDVAESFENLGLVLSKHEKYDSALVYINKALTIYGEFLDQHHPTVLSARVNLAEQYEKNGQIDVADSIWLNTMPGLYENLKTQYVNMSNIQRIDYLNRIQATNQKFYSYASKHDKENIRELAANYQLNTKSIALDYAISTERLINQINDPALSEQNRILQELTDTISIVNQMPIDENPPDILALEEERALIANKILNHPVLAKRLNMTEVHWTDIQEKLSSDEAAIDFLRAYDEQDSIWTYYAIILLKGQDHPQFIKTSDESKLKELLQVDDLQYPDYLQNRRKRKALYNELWAPIAAHLNGIKTLHVSPTQSLYKVPFESLQNEKNNYLVENHTFHYYTSLRDFYKEKNQKTNYKNILLLGDILYASAQKEEHENIKPDTFQLAKRSFSLRSGIKPLPETREEIIKIEKISNKAGIQSQLLTSDQASEQTINRYTTEGAPSIVHFATHGVSIRSALDSINQNIDAEFISSDNPLQKSALLLSGSEDAWVEGKKIRNDPSDGILTALEVTSMALQNTQLVVLSACSTGLGSVYKSEGVFGLQRAFKIAGVNNVIASLWDVNDKATKDLMIAFYHYLLEKKQDPAIALRHAKMELKNKGFEPFDWSGFLLIE